MGNPAQSPPDGFARNLRADFPSYCPEIPCQTYSLPAEFLCNLPKNLTTHLTHKLCAVLPWKSLIVYAVMNVVPVSSYLAACVSITPGPNRIYT